MTKFRHGPKHRAARAGAHLRAPPISMLDIQHMHACSCKRTSLVRVQVYPIMKGDQFKLRSGQTVTSRPIRPDDAPALVTAAPASTHHIATRSGGASPALCATESVLLRPIGSMGADFRHRPDQRAPARLV
jgi:hypothetical protein